VSEAAQPWGDLDLAPIGNCAVSALVDRRGAFVWACAPRVDGDPLFSALLGGVDPLATEAQGVWAIELEGLSARSRVISATPPCCGRC
jgi:hypothetical protein